MISLAHPRGGTDDDDGGGIAELLPHAFSVGLALLITVLLAYAGLLATWLSHPTLRRHDATDEPPLGAGQILVMQCFFECVVVAVILPVLLHKGARQACPFPPTEEASPMPAHSSHSPDRQAHPASDESLSVDSGLLRQMMVSTAWVDVTDSSPAEALEEMESAGHVASSRGADGSSQTSEEPSRTPFVLHGHGLHITSALVHTLRIAGGVVSIAGVGLAPTGLTAGAVHFIGVAALSLRECRKGLETAVVVVSAVTGMVGVAILAVEAPRSPALLAAVVSGMASAVDLAFMQERRHLAPKPAVHLPLTLGATFVLSAALLASTGWTSPSPKQWGLAAMLAFVMLIADAGTMSGIGAGNLSLLGVVKQGEMVLAVIFQFAVLHSPASTTMCLAGGFLVLATFGIEMRRSCPSPGFFPLEDGLDGAFDDDDDDL